MKRSDNWSPISFTTWTRDSGSKSAEVPASGKSNNPESGREDLLVAGVGGTIGSIPLSGKNIPEVGRDPLSAEAGVGGIIWDWSRTDVVDSTREISIGLLSVSPRFSELLFSFECNLTLPCRLPVFEELAES